jgi:hypothetical protein
LEEWGGTKRTWKFADVLLVRCVPGDKLVFCAGRVVNTERSSRVGEESGEGRVGWEWVRVDTSVSKEDGKVCLQDKYSRAGEGEWRGRRKI